MEIRGSQIRAARALLGWTARDLAGAAQVHVATIQRFETGSHVVPVVKNAIIAALQAQGVEFVDGGARIKSDPKRT
jgi:transcriptional regulator with XRE-family HTH domain